MVFAGERFFDFIRINAVSLDVLSIGVIPLECSD
jgi:hypothetical protein